MPLRCKPERVLRVLHRLQGSVGGPGDWFEARMGADRLMVVTPHGAPRPYSSRQSAGDNDVNRDVAVLVPTRRVLL